MIPKRVRVGDYVFSEDDQGSLLCSQLHDEARVESKVPDVSFIASVEEDGPLAPQPKLLCRQRPQNQPSDPDLLGGEGVSSPVIRYLWLKVLLPWLLKLKWSRVWLKNFSVNGDAPWRSRSLPDCENILHLGIFSLMEHLKVFMGRETKANVCSRCQRQTLITNIIILLYFLR